MLLRNLRLIDGTGALQERVDVRIRDGRFAEIAPVLNPDPDATHDFDGATALPAPIDAHTHRSLNPTPHATAHAPSRSPPYPSLLPAYRAAPPLAPDRLVRSGCHAFVLYRSFADDGLYVMVESWARAADLAAHKTSPAMAGMPAIGQFMAGAPVMHQYSD